MPRTPKPNPRIEQGFMDSPSEEPAKTSAEPFRRTLRSLDCRTVAESWHESNLGVVDVFIDDGDGAVRLFEYILRSEWDVHTQFVGSHVFPKPRCARVSSFPIVCVVILAVHLPSHGKRFFDA